MSPVLIDTHEKKLFWPDLNDPELCYIRLENIRDLDGNEHEAILNDNGGGMAFLHLRDIRSGVVSASFTLEFCLTPPDDFPSRVPQVTSAYVNPEFRMAKLSQAVYRTFIDHYGVLVSDSYQTLGGMLIWLFMAEDKFLKINIMEVIDDCLRYRLVNDEPEAYVGDIAGLESAGDTIWGGTDFELSQYNIERLGFKPSYRKFDDVVLSVQRAS